MDTRWRAAALRRARMLTGKSLDEVAVAVGVTRPALSQWELGISRPSTEHLERLADYYVMPLDTLLDRPNAPLSMHDWYCKSRYIPADERAVDAPRAAHLPRPQHPANRNKRGVYRQAIREAVPA